MQKGAQSHTVRSEVNEMHTSKVVAAYIRILEKDFAQVGHIAPDQLVTYSNIIITVEILLDVGMAEEEHATS